MGGKEEAESRAAPSRVYAPDRCRGCGARDRTQGQWSREPRGSLLTSPQTLSPPGTARLGTSCRPTAPCPCRCPRCCSAVCPPEAGAHEGHAAHARPGLVPGSKLGQLYVKMVFFVKTQNYLFSLNSFSKDKNNNPQRSPGPSFQPHPDTKHTLYLSSLKGEKFRFTPTRHSPAPVKSQ